jgi:hypothetical protein
VVTLDNEHLQQLHDICSSLEGLAGAPSESSDAIVRDAMARWAELGGDADDELSQRFARAVAAIGAAAAPAGSEPIEAPVVETHESPAPAADVQESGPDAVETPAVEPPAADIPAVEAPAVEPHEAEAHEDDHVPVAPTTPPPVLTEEERAERRTQLGQMLDGATQLLAATDLPDARARWMALRREWTALVHGLDLDDETTARLKGIEAQIDAREAGLREARTRHQQENLARLQQLCDQLEKLAQSDKLALRDVERALREARAALDAPGPLPSRQDQQAIVARLKGIQGALFPRVQDLREADEWERWANAGVQESLIKQLEVLREEADLAKVAKQLRHVQDEWHKVRAVPREKGRELWQRYKTIEGEIRARCEEHFQQVALERGENLRQKELLCEQAESLAESTDWIRTAETIKGLQAQWKGIGPVTPGHEKAIWERFRAACDRFFTRRKDDLTERKTVWAGNLQKKEALCTQIEALAETADWDRAMLEVKRLQNDWRTIGPVKRNRADAVLLRFRGACEKFFDAYAHRNDRETAQQAAAREQLITSLEALAPAADAPAPGEMPEDLVKNVLALKRQWDQSPGIPREQSEALGTRYAAALARIVTVYGEAFAGTELDSEQNRKRLEQLCQTVENLAGEEKVAGHLSPAEILAKQLREALAANTIGGRVDDEAKWRNAAEEIKKAQSAWRRVGPVPEAVGRELDERFQHACNRFFKQRDQRRKPAPSR